MEQFLIERLQNFTLDRKILSIDSDDRDRLKWPNASEFEVSTPQNYNKVESIRLINIQIPNQLYNISEHLQNNKMIIDISSNYELIVLDDGYYSNIELCKAIETKINKKLSNNNSFNIYYNSVTQKSHFINEYSDFSLVFYHNDISYSNNCINKVYNENSNQNLGLILGFDNNNIVKSNVQDNSSNSEIYFYHNNTPLYTSSLFNNTNVIVSPNKLNLNFNQYIYLEIDKYNTCDESKPVINNRTNNVNSGFVNSYFSKIPIIFKSSDINQSLSCKEDYIDSLSYYQPVIEKISKFKFKFRYHNGELIELGNYNISLTLEINQIRNEMKDYNVRLPYKF